MINLPLVDVEVRFPTETSSAATPRRKARRFTLASPGAPPDPDRCTCNPSRWRGIEGDRIRHEPTCPRWVAPAAEQKNDNLPVEVSTERVQ